MPSIGVIIAERNQIAFYRGLLNKLPIGVESIFNEKTIKKVQIQAKSVRKGTSLIAKNLDLEIKQGDRIVINGRSGSGKSTLARLLAGIETSPDVILKINGTQIEPNIVLSDFCLISNQSIVKDASIYENIAFNAHIDEKAKNEFNKFVKISTS